MNFRISKQTRKYILLYVFFLVLLYLVIVIVPKMTDFFQTTEILEPGTLVLSSETTGYLIKTEGIAVAEKSGALTYKRKEKALVGKDWRILSIESGEAIQEAGAGNVSSSFARVMSPLKGFERLEETDRSMISGIVSLSMDGNEKYFSPENMDKITEEDADDRPLNRKSLKRSNTTAGDPVFKITSDGRWYLVCWLKKKEKEKFAEGQDVTLSLPEGTVPGRIERIEPERKKFRVIITSNNYYKDLDSSRKVKFTISGMDSKGLLVDNDCIVSKHGKKGVYVRDKNGEYQFTQVQVINTDGKESVVSESRFYDEKGKTVLTVTVYDEILKNPKGQLKKELKKEKKEKEEAKEKEAEEKGN